MVPAFKRVASLVIRMLTVSSFRACKTPLGPTLISVRAPVAMIALSVAETEFASTSPPT